MRHLLLLWWCCKPAVGLDNLAFVARCNAQQQRSIKSFRNRSARLVVCSCRSKCHHHCPLRIPPFYPVLLLKQQHPPCSFLKHSTCHGHCCHTFPFCYPAWLRHRHRHRHRHSHGHGHSQLVQSLHLQHRPGEAQPLRHPHHHAIAF